MSFYFYLVGFTFSISYSVLPSHLAFVFRFLHLFYFFLCPFSSFYQAQQNSFHIHIYKQYLQGIYRRRQWHPTPVLLPGKSHGRRSLAGCRLWGRTDLDRTEATQQQQQQQLVQNSVSLTPLKKGKLLFLNGKGESNQISQINTQTHMIRNNEGKKCNHLYHSQNLWVSIEIFCCCCCCY